MKILHTSDWHLGRRLYGKQRYDEFKQFLTWLLDTIKTEEINTLLVAGDIFDTTTPSNTAQELYYTFLTQVANISCCRHIVIIAGNHDSPSFLDAPKQLLKALNVHVVSSITEVLADEVLVLRKADQTPEAIVCAVPYLRDKDIRTLDPGETSDEKNCKMIAGLKKHYADVCEIAVQKRAELQQQGYSKLPIIAMGHLFTAGATTYNDDGVRELYVGSLAHVGKDVFPQEIDYLALGHLHIPQTVGGAEHIRYSGSPIPMGYGEAKQQKEVIVLEFNGITPNIQKITIPCFQQLIRIVGTIDDIRTKLNSLIKINSSAWIEIECTDSSGGNVQEMIDDDFADSDIKILRIKNNIKNTQIISSITENETLEDLNIIEVFNRCLDAEGISEESRKELLASYNEIIQSLHDEDINAK
jgi:exonuclease SbcD